MKAMLRLFAVVSAALIALSAAHAAAPSQEIELILDASGSMQAQMGGEAKIAIAKRVLSELVAGMKSREDLSLGVRAYGHQFDKSKKNCQDTKLEIPFGAPDPAKVSALIGRIAAQGQTPIAYSLLEAGKDFGKAPGVKRSVILITDGIESCDGDPCAAAKELAAKGLEVKLHVVGFDLKAGELEKLRCLTAPSGGLLIAAKDAAQLKGALDQVVKKALAENLVLRVLGADRQPIECYVEVFAAGTEQRVANGVSIEKDRHVGFNLPAGAYDVMVLNNVTSERRRVSGIVIEPEKVTEKEVIFARAGIDAIAKGLGGAAVPGYVTISRPEAGEDKFVSAGESGEKPIHFDVPPGTYRVKIADSRTNEAKVFDNVVLGDGQQITREAAFGEARIKISTKDMSGNPTPTTVEIKKVAGEVEEFLKAGEVGAQPVTFYVPPGSYRVVVSHDKTKEKKTIDGLTLADGQEVVKDVTFGIARLYGFAKDAAGSPVKASIEINMITPTGERTIFLEDNGAEPRPFTVAPGTYKMTFRRQGTGEVKVIDGIKIENGQEVKKEAVF